jgi:peptide/nickel transport system ATP-binding protein
MYVGKIVETAPKKALFSRPQHPYTEALLSAVPQPDPRAQSTPIVLQGDVADPANPPAGCYFHPRCRYSDGQRCVHEAPQLREIATGHFVSCHYAEKLQLRGITLRKGVG